MDLPNAPWNRRQFVKAGLTSCATAAFATSKLLGNTVSKTIVNTESPIPETGWVIVTEAPYFADSTGETDSTDAIQRALNDSRNRTTVCFFPSGTYLISDTLSCEQRVEKLDQPRYTDDMRQSWWDIRSDRYYILGSTHGQRPVIKLAPTAKGFDDPKNPKLAMRIWAQTRNDVPGTHEPEWGSEQPNILFSQVFRGVDFDISGHPGAIALRFAGSQGCSLMDCRVNAAGAFAGFNNCPGQGGGSHNLEVIGGRHALWADSFYRFPMLAACRFIDQEDAAIVYSDASLPLVLAGCYFRSKGNALVDLTRIGSFAGISIVDSILEMPAGGSFLRSSRDFNLLLENVWIRGAQRLSSQSNPLPDPTNWTHVDTYANCSDNSESLIDGETSQETFFVHQPATSAPSEKQLHALHWTPLPSFEDEDAVNIRDFGAIGDGDSDDSDALKAALRHSPKVFFPAGTYFIGREISLPPNTCLFGYKGAVLEGGPISTHQATNDRTVIAFLTINSTVAWGAGQGVWAFTTGNFDLTETGGGRFYASRFHNSHRGGLLFENTRQPITVYTLNIERRTENPQAYLSNVRNLRIFYLKAEASPVGYNIHGGPNTGNTPLRIINSTKVRVYGACGNVLTVEDRPFIEIVDSRDVKVCHAKSFHAASFPQIRESYRGAQYAIPSQKTAALFVRS